METLKELKNHDQIDFKDFEKISRIIFDSFSIHDSNVRDLNFTAKEVLLNDFSSFLNKCLELSSFKSKNDKLAVIKFIDKFNSQKYQFDLIKNQPDISDIKKAGERLGKKSQSAFETVKDFT